MVGKCDFVELFECSLPYVKVTSHLFEEAQYLMELAPAIHLQPPQLPLTVARQLVDDYILLDWTPEIELMPRERGFFEPIFKLAEPLNSQLQRCKKLFQLSNSIGFQVRCREDKNSVIDRASNSSKIAIIESYLEQVKDQHFFFCTDSQFVEQYVVSKRPDACYIPKNYTKVEGNDKFISRSDKRQCLIAAVEFFCLMECKMLLKWNVGGWTQFARFLRK